MSIGPPALGNVLVQRLDAVLGTTMAAHANLVNGARPDAVSQPGEAAPIPAPGDPTRDPRRPAGPALDAGRHPRGVADAASTDTQTQAARGQFTSDATTASAPTTLGQTARTILALLARYPDPAPPAQGRQPLWQPDAPGAASPAARGPAAAGSAQASSPLSSAASAPTSASLAQSLRQALQSSGLFYESHLAELAFGRRQPAQLAQEPQARLQPAATATASATPASDEPNAAPGAASQQGGSPLAAIHPDGALLARQQLDVLANQALAWQGLAWPGAEMTWQIERDIADQDNTPQAHWSTLIKLALPRLGLVEARISLAGKQLAMHVLAPLSAAELGRHTETLRERMDAAGLVLSQIDVHAISPQDVPPT